MKGVPITPDEIIEATKPPEIPDYIFDSFNKLIKDSWDGKQSVITISDAINRIMLDRFISRSVILNNAWLEVDDFYREKGWDVKFIKPDYTEFFISYWVFSKNKKVRTDENDENDEN